MTDFVSGLREELVAAAAQRERRSLSARPLVPVLAAAAAVAAILLAVALLNPRPGAEEGRSVAPRTGDARPLFGGTLEPGVRYGTVALVPALTLEVGDGLWMAVHTEDPGFFALERQAPPPEGFGQRGRPTGVLDIGRLPQVYDPAKPGLERSVVPAPADLAGWLRSHPDIDAGPARPARVGGVDGVVMDVTYRFAKPAHAAPECRYRGFRCTALAPGDRHAEGSMARIWVLESEPGPLVIQVEANDAKAFRELIAAAKPVVDSLELTPP
jgi:hypothetical protein